MNICGYIPESINEGPGLRAVVFISGCTHRCPGCFSPHTWSFQAGKPFTLELQQQIIGEMAENPLLGGLTIAGGDPFFSAAETSKFVQRVRAALPDFSIWIYSGYTWEEIIHSNHPEYLKLLQLCDVLIDGRFDQQQRDVSLLYRGSRNQRIVDINRSMVSGQAVCLL